MADEPVQFINNSDLAEFIASPGNVSKEIIQEFWPFIDKSMAMANLQTNDILDIKDLMFIDNIQKRSRMTRLQKQRFARGMNTKARAYNTASLTLGLNGLALKRITGSYRHVSMDQGEGQKRGLIGRLIHRGGGGE